MSLRRYSSCSSPSCSDLTSPFSALANAVFLHVDFNEVIKRNEKIDNLSGRSTKPNGVVLLVVSVVISEYSIRNHATIAFPSGFLLLYVVNFGLMNTIRFKTP